MVNRDYSSLGVKWSIAVPQTVAELITAAGSEEAVVNIGNNHIVFHAVLTGVRDDFAELVEQATGIARKTKVTGKNKAGEDVVEFDESEAEYIDRVCAEREVDAETLADLAVTVNGASTTVRQEVLRRNPYDAKPRERQPAKPRTPSKGDFGTADALIKVGGEKLAQVVDMLSQATGLEVTADRDSLARAIMHDRLAEQERVRKAQQAKYGLPTE